MIRPFLHILILVGFLGVATYALQNPPKLNAEITTQKIHVSYAADFSDNRILVGASHNIFVGRVLQQSGSRDFGIPETQFEVVIIENIKGELKGKVVVNQDGGIKDGVLYVVEGGHENSESDEEYLLQPGATYLFATRYNEQEDWYTLNSYPTARKLISRNAGDGGQLKSLAQADDRVGALKEAYKKEVPLKVDVMSGKAFNGYEEFKKKESEIKKEAIEEGSEEGGENIQPETPENEVPETERVDAEDPVTTEAQE